jgi:hypothetical protein
MWTPELVWLWVKRGQISCKVSRNTAVGHSERDSSIRFTPSAHKFFMFVQFMLCFLFITPRHPTRNQVTGLLKRVTKVSWKHSHWWAEISIHRPRSGTDREQLNNWEVFVWRIGTWDCPSTCHVLSRCFVQCSGVRVMHCGHLFHNSVIAKCFGKLFFFCGATTQLGPRPPHCWGF